ncbi:MAG TPA: DUF2505 domain-containing protein [Pseudomonadales bacterium]|nr:DUF2505 domain-containing protein [Pseudomonadales bacterium]
MNVSQCYFYQVPTQTLMSAFLDEQYIHRRYHSAGVEDYQISQFGLKSGKFIVQVKRTVKIRPTEKIPSLVKKFVKDRNQLTTTIAWEPHDGETRKGEFSFAVEGVPGEVKGLMYVKPTPEGCVHQFDLTIKSPIPFVGEKIAQMVAQRVVSALEKYYQYTLEYLRSSAEKAK